MMSGLIFAGINPVKAIKYQIMVTFMLLSTTSLSTIIACYLTYRKFYNSRHQLVVTQIEEEMMRCRMRSIASGVVVHVPINGISIQQCIQLAAILRRRHHPYPAQRGSPGTFYASDRLRRSMFTQMPNSNSSASSLRPT